MKRMTLQKIAGVIVASAILAAGCAGNGNSDGAATKEPAETANAQTENTSGGGGIEVDKNLTNVKITLPASMVGDRDIDEVIADAEKDGAKDVVVNDDGSITYTMSKSDHNQIMKEMSDSITEYIAELKTDGTFASVKDIAYNDSFSEFTVVVDQAAFQNSMDGFVTLGLGMQGTLYQIFEGIASDKQKVTIEIKDESTGEVFNTVTYPDALTSE